MTMRQQPFMGTPRVGIYNRCSTEEEAQKNALAVQAEESREIAAVRKKWIVTAQYIESESGTSTRNRTEYQRLLADMEKDIFDIVMIKSIDRLMRSAKDWYLFLNRLTGNNKQLYIYIDDKFYTPDDSLISGIRAILAEEFSRELSKKIRNSHGRRQELHRQKKPAGLNITRPMFGWDKIEKDVYALNDQEADAYRAAFDMAKAGKGFYTIANRMYELGVRGKTGGRISDVQWRKMLYSPRAHGAMVIHTREYDFDAKKYVSLPSEEWIYVENVLPPIVSRAYQEEVLGAVADRRTDCKFGEYTRSMSKTGMYDLSGKLICAECGAVYYRTTFRSGKRRLAEWKCSTAMKKGRNPADHGGCENVNLIDEEIYRLIGETCAKQYEALFGIQQNIIDEALDVVKRAIRDDSTQKELSRLKKEYEKLQKKKNVLFDKLMSETIRDCEFTQYHEKLEEQAAPLMERIRLLEEKKDAGSGYEERLLLIGESLNSGEVINQAKTKELIMKIDQIIVYPSRKIEIIFDRAKFSGLSKTHDSGVIENELDGRFFRIMTEYVHTNMFVERRKEMNRRILEIFREDPSLPAKELARILGVTDSYVNTSIKTLKDAGRLQYERLGRNRGGIWHVFE